MKNFSLKINGNNYETNIRSHEDDILEIEVNGTLYKVELEKKRTKTPVIKRGAVKKTEPTEIKKVNTGSKIESPLPGVVMEIKVKEGDIVKKGDNVLILEAMKMENDVQTEFTGVVKKINVSAGTSVLQGDILIEIE